MDASGLGAIGVTGTSEGLGPSNGQSWPPSPTRSLLLVSGGLVVQTRAWFLHARGDIAYRCMEGSSHISKVSRPRIFAHSCQLMTSRQRRWNCRRGKSVAASRGVFAYRESVGTFTRNLVIQPAPAFPGRDGARFASVWADPKRVRHALVTRGDSSVDPARRAQPRNVASPATSRYRSLQQWRLRSTRRTPGSRHG
jgi:hypothetical protein